MDTIAIHVLAGRLNTGWVMCDRERDPVKRAKLEDYWIALLRQYEVACDQAEMIGEATAA